MIDRSLNYGRHHIRNFCASVRPVQKVLDLGAGHGDDLYLAGQMHPLARLYAVEVYEPYAKELEAKAVSVLRLDIERDRLPFQDQELDIVIANQVLEHTKELFWIFHEVTRVLRIGGSFIIGVPNLAALHNRVLLAMGRQPSPIKSNSAHVRGFTRRDLCAFVESVFPAGFALQQYGGSNFYPFPPVLARPLAKLLPNMAWGIFLRLEKKRAYDREFLDYPVAEKLETNFFRGTDQATA